MKKKDIPRAQTMWDKSFGPILVFKGSVIVIVGSSSGGIGGGSNGGIDGGGSGDVVTCGP